MAETAQSLHKRLAFGLNKLETGGLAPGLLLFKTILIQKHEWTYATNGSAL